MVDLSEAKTPQDFKAGKKKPNTRTVWICNDSGLAENYEEVSEELSMLRLRFTDPEESTAEIKRKFELLAQRETELRQLVRENSIKFVFRGIGRKRFEKIVAEFPATDEDRKKMSKFGGDPEVLQWSPDTFFPALCDACMVEPKDFDIKAAFDSDDWNDMELAALGNAALEANTTRRVVPLGNG